MWTLLRVLALAVLAAVVLLLAGQGPWLVDVADAVVTRLGVGPLPRDGHAVTGTVGTLGLAVGAAVALGGRRLVGQLDTLLHELAHTLVAAACGARPAGIVLRHDASGHATARWTVQPGPVRRLGLAATALAGLPAPAVSAAAGARLLEAAGPRAVLWCLAGAGVVVALLARSLWALVVAVGLAALALVGLTETAEPWAAGAVVAVLTATSVASALRAGRRLARPLPAGDDARAVQRHLGLPRRVVPRLVQLAQVVLAMAAGAWTVWLLLSAAGLDVAAWAP